MPRPPFPPRTGRARSAVRVPKEILWQRIFLVAFAVICLLFLATGAFAQDRDADGWTLLPATADARVVYVAADGDDAADGLSQATARKTIQAGYALIRNGKPDHLLLRRGDTFDISDLANGFRINGKSGKSPDARLVFGAYGDGPRPIVHGSVTIIESRNVALVSWDLVGPGDVALSVNKGRWGEISDILIEDVRVSGDFKVGVDILGTHRLTIRRCAILDNHHDTQFSHNLYADNTVDLVLEECLFDHGGYGAVGGNQVRSHGLYLGPFNEGFVLRDCVITRAQANGVKMMCGGTVEGNLFWQNPIALEFGVSRGAPTPEVVSGTIRGNVVMEGTDIAPGIPRGWAINVFNVDPILGVEITDNLAAHFRGATPGMGGGILGLSAGVTATGNVVYEWPKAFATSGASVWTDNLAMVSDPAYLPIWEYRNDVDPAVVEMTGNRFLGPDDPQPTLLDASRVPGDYLAYGDGGFHDALRRQRKGAWDSRFETAAIVAWLRAGYGVDAEPPVEPPVEPSVDEAVALADDILRLAAELRTSGAALRLAVDDLNAKINALETEIVGLKLEKDGLLGKLQQARNALEGLLDEIRQILER